MEGPAKQRRSENDVWTAGGFGNKWRCLADGGRRGLSHSVEYGGEYWCKSYLRR